MRGLRPIEYDRFNILGLADHILTYYDMNNPPSDLGDYNIFDEDCKPINDLKKCAFNNFRSHIKSMYHRRYRYLQYNNERLDYRTR